MNLIPEVAKLLDLEIGEEFKVVDAAGFDYGVFRLGENYIEQKLRNDKWLLSYEHMIGAIICGRLKVVKLPKQLLDKKEKEYLAYVIKPFKDKIEYLYKKSHLDNKNEWIAIKMKDDESVHFPSFKKDSMYKGMELERNYSLEELGL